jgi:hypothetical protein
MRRSLLAFFVVAIGCGGSSPTQPSNQTPPPPPAQTNTSPVITSVSVNPFFGVQQLTTFIFSASASDANGDALSYSWNISGTTLLGPTVNGTFSSGGNGTATVTVSDGKGGTVSDSRSFVVGSMTGRWNGTWNGFVFTSNLTQNNGGIVTGDYIDEVGPATLDPAVLNNITATGQIRLRYKGGPFTDFIFVGQMDNTGRRVTGTVTGLGYNETFQMTKQ